MNKKIIAALCGGVLVSGIAMADDFRFYTGLNLGYSKVKNGSDLVNLKDTVTTWTNYSYTSKTKGGNVGLLAGLRYTDNFGLELGFNKIKNQKVTFSGTQPAVGATTGDGSLKISNIYLDVNGYLPVSSEVELLGSVGFGRAAVKESINSDRAIANMNVTSGDVKTNKIGFRVGLGTQYKFDDNFAARATLGYQKVGKKGDYELIKSITSLNLALTYTFC